MGDIDCSGHSVEERMDLVGSKTSDRLRLARVRRRYDTYCDHNATTRTTPQLASPPLINACNPRESATAPVVPQTNGWVLGGWELDTWESGANNFVDQRCDSTLPLREFVEVLEVCSPWPDANMRTSRSEEELTLHGGSSKFHGIDSEDEEDESDSESDDNEGHPAVLYLQAWKAAQTQGCSYLYPRTVFDAVQTGNDLIKEYNAFAVLMWRFEAELADEDRQLIREGFERMREEAEIVSHAEELIARNVIQDRPIITALTRARESQIANPALDVLELRLSQIQSEDKILESLLRADERRDAVGINTALRSLEREATRGILNPKLIGTLNSLASSKRFRPKLKFPSNVKALVASYQASGMASVAENATPNSNRSRHMDSLGSAESDFSSHRSTNIPRQRSLKKGQSTRGMSFGRGGMMSEDTNLHDEESDTIHVGYITREGVFVEKLGKSNSSIDWLSVKSSRGNFLFSRDATASFATVAGRKRSALEKASREDMPISSGPTVLSRNGISSMMSRDGRHHPGAGSMYRWKSSIGMKSGSLKNLLSDGGKKKGKGKPDGGNGSCCWCTAKSTEKEKEIVVKTPC